MGMNDMTLYKDTDGTAYLIYTSSDNTKMVISRLTSDYATTSNTYITSSANANRSAPAVFKRGSIYFLLNSGQNSWTATANKYSTSTSMLGTWSTLTNPFQSSAEEDYTLAYHSQTTDVLTVQGRTDGYVYIGDRFDGSATASGSLYNSRHVWLPITFPYAGMMSISWASSWSLDSAFTSATLPTSVSNLTATKNGLSVNLSWTNNETNSYSLYLDRATDITKVFKKKTNVATCHNELIKDKRFVLVGRGMYGLKEWGHAAGVVKDVITETLKESGKPLTKQEIVEKVLGKRMVKPNTVIINLQDSKLFKKDKDGKYSLK
jgi:hypothetical protein